MSSHAPSYHGYRFPSEIISHAVWLYYRFALSFLDVEDLLAQRGITVTYETIRQWCLTFGRDYAHRRRPESLPSGSTLVTGSGSPLAANTGVRRVGRGDVCLLTDGGAGLDRGEARRRLIKLTVSIILPPIGVAR